MAGKCSDKCDEHSGHRIELVNNKERHQGHDNSIKELRASLKTKVPRWIFILLIGIVAGNFGFQVKVLNVVTSIDKNVAVLSERLENHMEKEPARESQAISYKTESGVKSCLVLAQNLQP